MCIRDSPRGLHKMIKITNDICCMFGGIGSSDEESRKGNSYFYNDIYFYSISEGYWSMPMTGGYAPTPRYGFGLDGFKIDNIGQILLLGGKTNDSQIDQNLYLLEEIDPEDKKDNWVLKDRQQEQQYIQKLKDSGIQVLKGQKNIPVIPKSTIELSEAEKYLFDQKKELGEMETSIKQIQVITDKQKERKQQLKMQIDKVEQEKNEYLRQTEQKLKDKSQRFQQNQQFFEKLKVLTFLERKKRKITEAKILALQSTFKHTENYIISVDSLLFQLCLLYTSPSPRDS
eukprot:TRINITY_DN8160_c0_g1_i2.p2 TRINITY_DN8160_c0_g1~~TRINITY_DN8160_c0_g1_i2.p2  ORF type:complete len:307 (+),score=36.65 TRINITY_DN8160_c0_g1_i2:64-921(+)